MEDNSKKLCNISIEKLKPSKLNHFEVNDIEEMQGSIMSLGLLTPLSVIGPDEDGYYNILSGERRYTAIKKITEEGNDEFQEVPCYILDSSDMDEIIQEITIIASNVETRDFDKNQYRFHIIKLLKNLSESGEIKKNKVVAEAGKYMKVSRRYRSMYMQIFEKGSDDLMDMVGKKTTSGVTLTVVDANTIATMDEDTQNKAIEDIKAGEKPKDVIKSIKGTVDEEETKENGIVNDSIESENNEQSQKFMININSADDVHDIDTDSLFEYMKSNRQDTELSFDTTGEFKGLRLDSGNNTSGSNSEKIKKENEKEYKHFLFKVNSWCEKMSKSTDFTNEEMEVFESMRYLLEHIDETVGVGIM